MENWDVILYHGTSNEQEHLSSVSEEEAFREQVHLIFTCGYSPDDVTFLKDGDVFISQKPCF